MPDFRDVRRVLLLLALTSNGATAGYDSALKTHPASRQPTGDEAPHDYYWRLWIAAETDEERDRIAQDAREHLEHVRRRRVPPSEETAVQRDARIVREGQGLEVGEAALAFWCGPRDIVRARVARGRDPLLGERRGRPRTVADRRARVAEMVGAGATHPQVASLLGCSERTVRNDLSALSGHE